MENLIQSLQEGGSQIYKKKLLTNLTRSSKSGSTRNNHSSKRWRNRGRVNDPCPCGTAQKYRCFGKMSKKSWNKIKSKGRNK